MQFGAYFYPLTTNCLIKQSRAGRHDVPVCDETKLIQEVAPLFQGHQQPNTYCLGNANQTNWDDSSQPIMEQQIGLAEKYGIDFFIFDTYLGRKNGRNISESEKPLNEAFIPSLNAHPKFGFANMICLESPRAVIPSHPFDDKEAIDRTYEITKKTAEFIVNYSHKNYWSHPNYFRINGKPYVSIWPPPINNIKEKEQFLNLISEIRDYAKRKYKIDLYLVGVLKGSLIEDYNQVGVDAITGYAMLADFKDTLDIQNHPELIQTWSQGGGEVKPVWDQIADLSSVPFIPPAVVGWDASPRGQGGYSIEEIGRRYPYFPMVVNGNSQLYETMLERSVRHTQNRVPKNEQYALTCAWNEVSEGCALLPKFIDGKPDFSYLAALERVKSKV